MSVSNITIGDSVPPVSPPPIVTPFNPQPAKKLNNPLIVRDVVWMNLLSQTLSLPLMIRYEPDTHTAVLQTIDTSNSFIITCVGNVGESKGSNDQHENDIRFQMNTIHESSQPILTILQSCLIDSIQVDGQLSLWTIQQCPAVFWTWHQPIANVDKNDLFLETRPINEIEPLFELEWTFDQWIHFCYLNNTDSLIIDTVTFHLVNNTLTIQWKHKRTIQYSWMEKTKSNVPKEQMFTQMFNSLFFRYVSLCLKVLQKNDHVILRFRTNMPVELVISPHIQIFIAPKE